MATLNGAAGIGSSSDGHTAQTLFGRNKEQTEHIHATQLLYPSLGAAITVTAAAGAWALGAAATIVAGSTITDDFDVHHICVSNISGNDDYQLELYDDGVVACTICFTKSPTTDPVRAFSVVTPLMGANSAITAKLASAGGGSDTCDVKIVYHVY